MSISMEECNLRLEEQKGALGEITSLSPALENE